MVGARPRVREIRPKTPLPLDSWTGTVAVTGPDGATRKAGLERSHGDMGVEMLPEKPGPYVFLVEIEAGGGRTEAVTFTHTVR